MEDLAKSCYLENNLIRDSIAHNCKVGKASSSNYWAAKLMETEMQDLQDSVNVVLN